ncbi:hypothetical protein M744_10370 [Synechococcus elongatus UTEX 2973]|nr:hypothetical protein M744_10370 [Synechococcus elongatus UTEX 2973]
MIAAQKYPDQSEITPAESVESVVGLQISQRLHITQLLLNVIDRIAELSNLVLEAAPSAIDWTFWITIVVTVPFCTRIQRCSGALAEGYSQDAAENAAKDSTQKEAACETIGLAHGGLRVRDSSLFILKGSCRRLQER